MSAMRVRTREAIRSLIVGFDQVIPEERTNEILSTLIEWHLSQLSTAGWAEGLHVSDCIKNGDLRPLYGWSPDVEDLSPADRFHLTQCAAFFSKRRDLDIGVDRETEAVRKFLDAEDACRLTNACFLAHSQGRFQFRPDVEGALHAAQRKVCDALGPAPSIEELRPRFGPGATTQTPKKNACPGIKLGSVPACASNTAHRAGELLAPFARSEQDRLTVKISSSKSQFVPKSLKSFRTICVEPALNSFYQNGIGDLMAGRIKRVGLDITDQSKNQRLALYGSIGGRFATLDLSSASDTIAWRLVEHLLPSDWFDLLYLLSTRETSVEGGPIFYLEKMSSMGNGFTFPLETLIFWALAQACADRTGGGRASAYGDDIIVPTAATTMLIGCLTDLGFTPNPSKSFWAGPFRESCGKDYQSGIDVRPCFLKGQEKGLEGGDYFALHNFYFRRGMHHPCRLLEAYIHSSIRLFGPDGYGDGHLLGAYIPKLSMGRGCIGYRFDSFSFEPNAIADEFLSNYAGRSKVREVGGKTEAIVYRGDRLPYVLRVACYTTYVREDPVRSLLRGLEVKEEGAASSYRRPTFFDLTCEKRRDDAPWVVPGRGPLRRVSLYTFEPAILTQ